MPRRPALLTLALLLFAAPACRHGDAHTDAPVLVAPAEIHDLDDYADAGNAYALLPLDHPDRSRLRGQLRDFIAGYVDQAITEDRAEAAYEGLRQLAALWTPGELHTRSADPATSAIAIRVYGAVAPAGDEIPSLLALAFMQHFGGEADRAKAELGFAQVLDWVERSQGFSGDPRFGSDLDRLLEETASVLPTPFLTQALADSYLARYREAQRDPRFGSDPRIGFTGYLVARAHLCADDPAKAIAAIDRIEVDSPTQGLRDLIFEATDPTTETNADLAQLILEFLPGDENNLPQAIVRQSWMIVDNLARRVLRDDPDDAPANLARGRVLRARGLGPAAVVHYELALKSRTRATSRDDLHAAWTELAGLYQLTLEDEVRRGTPAEIDTVLAKVDDFHQRASQTWPQRPIRPGLPVAWMTVALARFNAGAIDDSERLLREAVVAEPYPLGLSLLGTIALREGHYDEARDHLQRIPGLPFADQLERYDWQIKAGLLLAETERFAGDDAASRAHLREVLSQVNTLLAYPGLHLDLRAEFLGRRAMVFFQLGEMELAMQDFREAHSQASGGIQLYADALSFAVVHGQLEQAQEMFAATLSGDPDGDLQVYFALWILDLGARSEHTEKTAAKTAAEAYLQAFVADSDNPSDNGPSNGSSDNGEDAWARELARYGLGELDSPGLLAAAGRDPRRRSEALFYTGLQQWRSGSHDAGLAAMREVVAAGMMSDFEYQMAQQYLLWNELPSAPRAALAEQPL